MFHKILVPLDGSLVAENAIEIACTLARAAHGGVILLRVPTAAVLFVPMAGTTGVLWPDQSLVYSRQEARKYLAALEKTWASPDVSVRTLLHEGDVASVIVDTAAAEGVDLICMSTHGHSGFTRWMLGSTTEKILRAAQCPTLVLRSRQPPRRILVTLDGSPLAETAVAPALALARCLSAEVTLLRVVDDLHGVSRAELAPLEHLEKGSERRAAEGAALLDQAGAYLAAVEAREAVEGLTIHRHVEEGSPADVILNYAAAHASDLIAIATHGRTGLRRWVYGSITEKVLRTAHCSMLIVRPAARDLR